MGIVEFDEEHFERPVPEKVDPEKFAKTVAQHFGTTLEEMRTPRRLKHLVKARDTFCVGMHRAGWSLTAIGDFIHRDHTTVLASIRKTA